MLSVVDNIGELTDPVAKDNDASLLGELLVNLNMAMAIDEESQGFWFRQTKNQFVPLIF